MIGVKELKIKNVKWKMPNTKSGFTLMEMLVALGLFSIVVVIATDVFFTFQKISRKTENLQKLTTDARFIIETIARYGRESSINYSAYARPIALPQPILAFLGRTQVPVVIQAENCRDDDEPEFRCITIARGDSPSERLSSHEVWVRSLQFYIAPAENPSAFDVGSGTYRTDAQPRVTIAISLANNADENTPDYTRYDVQTTITSRIYTR